MIAEKLGREFHIFWVEFHEEFGRTGRRPRDYWDGRIGHVIPSVGPHNVGELTPMDLLWAVRFFDSKYGVG